MFHRFSRISGLTLNQGKTQVMAIGKPSDKPTKLAEDLDLNWVEEITILGIKLYANPERMLSNFDEKVDDIKKLLNRWTFRPLTNYEQVKYSPSLKVLFYSYPKNRSMGENRAAERDSKFFSRARSSCFNDAQYPIGQDQLKNQIYLLRFSHTRALLLKNK